MPAGGRKNDTTGRGSLSVDRPGLSRTTSSFFDVSFIRKVAAEARSAAEDVESLSAATDPAAIELAKQSVSQYSPTAQRVSSSIAHPFFESVEPRSPTPQRRDDVKLFPFIDRVEVGFTRDGVVDGFRTTIVVSVTTGELDRVAAIRLFRRDMGPTDEALPLSISGMGMVAIQSGRKSPDKLVTYERFQRERGSLGGLARSQPDGLLNLRGPSEPVKPRAAVSQGDVQRRMSVRNLSGMVPREVAARMDPGVSLDLRTVSRVRSIGSTLPAVEPVGRLFAPKETLARRSITVEPPRRGGEFGTERRNSSGFREIHFATVSSLSRKDVGDISELSFTDLTVLRGSRYSYYAVLVDREMRESKRSEIVTVTVDHTRPPGTPDIFVSSDGRRVHVQALSDEKFIEKFEIYRRERVPSREPLEILAVSLQGVELQTRPPTSAGWVQVGEPISSQDGRTSFSDGRVSPGSSYEYRVYSVDCFGNKSPTPAEAVVSVGGRTPNTLSPLTLTAELDQKTKKTRVGVFVDSPAIRSVFITRRDVTVREHSFRDPLTPDIPHMGNRDAKRWRASDPVLYDQRAGWNGHIQVMGTGTVAFSDNTVRLDHSYQYCAYGMDDRGIRTPYAFSQMVFVSRRPLVNTPAGIVVSATTSSVRLSWKDSDVLFSPDELMGDRDALERASVRSLFQVQRREMGAPVWDDFPLIESVSFEDPVLDADPPPFRPAYPKLGRTYLYRVGTLQSGNYYSNFTDPVSVTVQVPPRPPPTLVVRCSDTRAHPSYVVVNWTGRGDVSHWLVERAAVNNFSAGSVSAQSQIVGLPFVEIARVTPESSRASSRESDLGRRRDPAVFVGERFYIDHDIEMGNSYFYRVSSVSIDGAQSDPAYRGIYVSNSTFERKLLSVLGDGEREDLSRRMVPMTMISGRFR